MIPLFNTSTSTSCAQASLNQPAVKLELADFKCSRMVVLFVKYISHVNWFWSGTGKQTSHDWPESEATFSLIADLSKPKIFCQSTKFAHL